MNASLLDEICTELSRLFGVRVDEANGIQRGFLNEKWRLRTNRGLLFVKSYHPDRYRRHMPAFWGELRQALQLQIIYREHGGACPALYRREDGECLLETPSGRKFVVMEHCPGQLVPAGQANPLQMRALGEETAAMHACWNTGSTNAGPVQPPVSGPVWTADRAQLLQAWEERGDAMQSAVPRGREIWVRQGELLRQIDFDALDGQTPGWAHLDLWADNILFAPEGLEAIIDFDRARYSYPALDLGRALLSCALANGRFRREAAAAFAEGYRQRLPLPKGALLNAARQAWLVESFWWLTPAMDDLSAAPRRFAQEMLWVMEQWDALEEAWSRI